MEKHEQDKIGEITDLLIKLLKGNKEAHWSQVLENIRQSYIQADSKSLVAE